MTDIRALKTPDGNTFYPRTHAEAVLNLAETILANMSVVSVNGKTGEVTLNAHDVGSYTQSEIDSAIAAIHAGVVSVNGYAGVVNLSADDVGAYTKSEIDSFLLVVDQRLTALEQGSGS